MYNKIKMVDEPTKISFILRHNHNLPIHLNVVHQTTMASYTCSLTGLPATNPVVTPSGHICSKSLLLTKLSENGGIDPFDSESKRTLDESDLIHLSSVASTVVPPRPPTATSLPEILKILQGEFDSVLLELYDTRKALEETRRELSTALYQNDAAVRVIARVCAERDEVKGRLEGVLNGSVVVDGGGEKRSREDEDKMEEEPSKKAKIDNASIPTDDLNAMAETSASLSAARRPLAKLKRSPEEISEIESVLASLAEKKVNVHKSNSNGVLGLNSLKWQDENYVVSIGKDGQILVYNVTKGVIGCTISCPGVDKVHSAVLNDTLFVCVSTEKEVKLFSVRGNEDEATLLSSTEVESVKEITIHPSSTAEAVRILIATPENITLLKHSKEMEVLAKLEDKNFDSKYVSGAMHPDGLIYALGTEGGKLIVWDLRSQVVASTLDVSEGNPIIHIAFSENGYHVATSTPSAVTIWDLRKQKLIGTIEGKVYGLAFDPTASYLAYAMEGVVKICVAKDWERVVGTYEYEKKKGGKGKKKKEEEVIQGGLVWGGAEKRLWLACGCDGEKPVRFWGVE